MVSLLTLGKLRLLVILLIWASQKLTLQQNPLRRNWMSEEFSRLLIHAIGSLPWLLRSVKVSTSSELLPQLLSIAYFSWLFRHPVFWFTLLSQHSQLGYLWLPVPHCKAPVWPTWHHAMPAVTRCFLPNPCLGKQRISIWVAIILSICLCICLIATNY